MNFFYSKERDIKLLLSTLITFLAADSFGSSLNLSQQPLFLTTGVSPNIFVTIDNSTSMQMAVVPDGAHTDTIRLSRRGKSSTFNGLYYNPNVVYTAPYAVSYNQTTGEITKTRLTTSFTNAYINGFKSNLGTVDLSTDYKVSWGYNPNLTSNPRGSTYANSGLATNGASVLAENPSADFFKAETITETKTTSGTGTFSATVYSTGTYDSNGVKFSVSGNSRSCSATFLTSKTTTSSGASTTVTTYPSSASCSVSWNSYRISAQTQTQTQTTTTSTKTEDKTKVGVPAYYYIYDTSVATCTSPTVTNDNCYRLVTVSDNSGINNTDERQNFAIWYSFYRNRALAAQTATNLALVDISDNVRLGWQALGDSSSCILNAGSANCRGITNSSSASYDNRLRQFSNSHRTAFFNWLGDIYYNQSTPLQQALERVGQLIKTTGLNGPYAFSPGSELTPEYSCRASYSLMVTDGIWNYAFNSGENDNSSTTLPDGKSFSPIAPYKDPYSNTLADLAFKYWAADAQPRLENNVQPYSPITVNTTYGTNTLTPYWNPKNDPATWQHLTGFYVGIGLSSALTNPEWKGDTYSGGFEAIASNALAWPEAKSGSYNNVYDLWHAAINSRGEFFSAESANELVSSMQKVVTRITESTNASAGKADSPYLEETNFSQKEIYKPTFSSSDWSGDLIKYSSTSSGMTLTWSAQSILDKLYKEGNTNYNARKIFISSDKTSNKLQDFSWENLNNLQPLLNRNLSGTDSFGRERVAFLRGSRLYETPTSTPRFRARTHILGDIVDSTPAYVSSPSLSAEKMNALANNSDSSYSDFKSKWAARAPRVYVGANDGMLHSFDSSGNETFSFIPTEVIKNLYKLTDTNYNSSTHQYYVNGSPVVSDVYFNNEWHTVLIGSLRGGGRSIFALDITDPSDIKLLWEKSAADIDYQDLGYTYAEPLIIRLGSGQWAVAIANGYNSKDDKAVLYLTDVKDGSLIKKFEVSDSKATPNGLSTPTQLDINNDLITDYLYAGDLHGNVWRFDLFSDDINTTALASQYRIAFGGTPLFTAKATTKDSSNTSQPITSAPYVLQHPLSGYMVLFGTGKYIEVTDAAVNLTKSMSLYGIWDKGATGINDTENLTVTRDKLQKQTIGSDESSSYTNSSGTTTNTIGNTISNNTITYSTKTEDDGKLGWYIDLPLNGEMVINSPKYKAESLIISTILPNDDPCSSGIESYVYSLDAYTGAGKNNIIIGNAQLYSRVKLSNLYSGPNTSLSSDRSNINISGTCVEGECKDRVTIPAGAYRQTWRSIYRED